MAPKRCRANLKSIIRKRMFTGIIEETGKILSIKGGKSGVAIDIEAAKVLEGTKTGDSIAVNGVCLTVTPGNGHFTAEAMPETIRRTSLSGLAPGSPVNLERAMPCQGRFGGHIVSGHVDACGRVESITRDGIALLLKVSAPAETLRYIAVKGSVTLDGASLTVTDADDCSLTVSLIPHTAANTTLGLLKPGSPVNIEADIIARYLERLMLSGPGGGECNGKGLTMEFLKENGF